MAVNLPPLGCPRYDAITPYRMSKLVASTLGQLMERLHMLRGIIGNRNADPVSVADIRSRAPQGRERTEARPREAASPGARWPWDGHPDDAACNFAVAQLARDLPAGLQVNGRVHAQTCLAAIGAIAGATAQHALISSDAAALGQLQTISTITGGHYFFGDVLNQTLLPVSKADAEGKLWSVAAGGAIAAGLHPSQLPDPDRLFANIVDTLGGKHEGTPRVPQPHLPQLPVKQLLVQIWPIAMMCFVGRFPDEPREFGAASIKFWPAIAAHVASILIRQTRSAVDPRTSLSIVMESAIFASKLTPGAFKGT
jgi:hypothetical protein